MQSRAGKATELFDKVYDRLGAASLLASIYNSFYVALIATSVTLLIGVPAAIALDRLDFPGKTVFRRLVLLPIALPGVITGVSMLNLFKLMGMNLSLETVILGHATGLVSIVVTQVFARLQRVNRHQAVSGSNPSQ